MGPAPTAQAYSPAPSSGAAAGAFPGGPADAEVDELDSAEDPPTLQVAAEEPVVVPGTSELKFSVLVRNPGTDAVPGGTVSIRFGAGPVLADEALATTLPAGAPQAAEAQLGEIAAGKERTTTVTVPRSAFPATDGSGFGVYLAEAEFRPDSGTEQPEDDDADDAPQASDADDADAQDAAPSILTATTPLVWRGASPTVNTVPLGLIVPLVLPDEIHTLPTRAQLEELTPGWDRLVTRARAQQATLAIDPRIVAGIRAYGDAAPEASRELLARLASLSTPTFLLQFADADPAAQAALGYSKLLEPTSLDFVTRYGTFPADEATSNPAGIPPEPEGTDPESPEPEGTDPEGTDAESPSPENTQEDVEGAAPAPEGDGSAEARVPPPTLSELLEWPTGESVAWPAEGAVDQPTLDLLERSGVSTTVLDSSNVSAGGSPRAQLPGANAYVTNAQLGAAAQLALSGESATERAHGSAVLTAELARAALSGSTGVLIGLDRGVTAEAEDPSALLSQISGLDWVTDTAIAELPAAPATLKAGDTLDDRRELLRTAAGRESSVNTVGAVLTHPEYLSGYQRTRLLELFATRFAHDPAEFSEASGAYRARDAELLSGVRVISTEHTQLVGTSTQVPVQVQNSLPFDAQVQVSVEPASAALALAERTFSDVSVPSEANQRVLVPVQSRVSSGESGLVVSVAASGGTPTVFTGTLPITIRSGVETIGIWVLGSLAALLLGFGIWRSVRRRARV